MKGLGNKILMARQYAGLLQKQLAAKIGVRENKISSYENDKALPDVFKLRKIADACGLHASYFFEDMDPYEYAQIGEDLEYAYYISRLPIGVQDYVRVAIRAMYTETLHQSDSQGKTFLKPRRNAVEKIPHADYFKRFKKSKGL